MTSMPPAARAGWSVSRLAAVAATVLVSAAFLLLVAGAVAHRDVPWTLKAILLLLFVASGAAPIFGAAVLIVLLPLVTVMAEGRLGAGLTDVLLLTFLSGASLRLALADRDRLERLRGPALVLIVAIIASAVVELHELQAIFPVRPLAAEIWGSVTSGSWIESAEFAFVGAAVRWIAGLVAAVYLERLIRRWPERARWIFPAWVTAGVAGALVTIWYVASRGHSWRALADIALHMRLSALQPDLNAAGSYFALFVLPVLVIGLARRALWLLVLVGPIVLLPFWLAQSRAAIGAVVLTFAAAGVRHFWRQKRGRMVVAGALAGAGVLAAALSVTAHTHVGLGAAAGVRVQLTEVGIQTARRYPVFGVGLGDYVRMSRRWVRPDMKQLYHYAPRGDNAHNNYLQILVELGLPACLLFLALVGTVAWNAWRLPPESTSPELTGMSLGLSAFLISAVFSHPLLAAPVSAAFFLALGITAGLLPPPAAQTRWHGWLVGAGVLFYALSVWWRLS